MRLVRVMCSGRVDLTHVHRALSKGADGVFIGGCHLNECNYTTDGNYQALNMVNIFKKIMTHTGINPERLRIGFMSGSEANLFVEIVSAFVKKIKELGPLGKSEGISETGLKFKLEAIARLIPYIKLVERQRLRVPFKSEEAIINYFASDEVHRLFQELISDKLSISQIMLLLRERPLTAGEISGILNLNSSEVSRHLNSSSRHGLVRYDESLRRYVSEQ